MVVTIELRHHNNYKVFIIHQLGQLFQMKKSRWSVKSDLEHDEYHNVSISMRLRIRQFSSILNYVIHTNNLFQLKLY